MPRAIQIRRTAITSPELTAPVGLSAVLKAAGKCFDDVVRAGAYLTMCVAVSVLSFNACAQGTQDERQYAEGPVTLVQEIAVEYGHFEDYIDWLNSTWKPTMEATKEAGIIIDYKVFSSTPPSPDHPDVILWITYKNMAALDRGVEEEAVAKKVICSTECQNKARVGRNEYRKVTRREYIRELILK